MSLFKITNRGVKGIVRFFKGAEGGAGYVGEQQAAVVVIVWICAVQFNSPAEIRQRRRPVTPVHLYHGTATVGQAEFRIQSDGAVKVRQCAVSVAMDAFQATAIVERSRIISLVQQSPAKACDLAFS